MNPRQSLIRERFNKAKDTALEHAMGKGESWAKKVGNGISGVMLDDIPRLLMALDLRVVDKGMHCVEKEIFVAYKVLAEASIKNSTPNIDDDDPE